MKSPRNRRTIDEWIRGVVSRWVSPKSAKSNEDNPVQLRRWDALSDDHTNREHWRPVTGASLNEDLTHYLDDLRTRCNHEWSNNPDLEGIVETHATDVIGEEGPTLQVTSSNSEYNKQLEETWRQWWNCPDVNADKSGVDLMGQWWNHLWLDGEFLVQKTKGECNPKKQGKLGSKIATRLHSLDPRQLASPMGQVGNSNVMMGIKLSDTNKPLEYYVYPADQGAFGNYKTEPETLTPDDVIHLFRVRKCGQVRGIPWLASALPIAAQLRAYDEDVMAAARAAALYGLAITCEDSSTGESFDAEGGESITIKRGAATFFPPGWKATALQPGQPAANYLDFRHEKLRQCGRPVGMPGMMVLLDSQKHNYSSARFDGQLYLRIIKKLRRWVEREVLLPLVAVVEQEARAAGILQGKPDDSRFRFVWPALPHVDPVKEATAAGIRIKNRISTLRDECAAENRDWEEQMEQSAKEQEKAEELGLLNSTEAKGNDQRKQSQPVRQA